MTKIFMPDVTPKERTILLQDNAAKVEVTTYQKVLSPETEGSARFWFESVELHEIVQTRVDEIFAEELKAAQGFVIINK